MAPSPSDPTPAPEPTARERVLSYLAHHNTVSLATVDREGRPWAATVFYVNLGTDLYFLSEPHTRHCQNILATGRVAGTINEDYRDWQQIKGIQLEGTAAIVESPAELLRALHAYLDKYPFVRSFLSPQALLQGVRIAGKALDVRLWRLRPERLWYLDNARGFSAREELPL
ncbi:MAG TPA: pyridoxamine 5'-phosphate oxidase family protein [Chloroflexota bacterium]|jgi:uncharacterized protein YhbP (UPF0306 family)|nr:pyridoxamine 5'-phosphate oxidase family protein [Chloroflexota bacterium]